MNQLELVIVLASTLIGGILYGWKAWVDSDEPFSERKFISGILNSVFAALVQFVGYAVLVQDQPLTVIVIVNAALAGAGLNATLGGWFESKE